MLTNLQLDFDQINLWFSANEVYISEKKTQLILIASPFLKSKGNGNIYLHDNTCNRTNCSNVCRVITKVSETKYLGFNIDESWTYKKHVNEIICRLRKTMPSLYKLTSILDKRNKRSIYYAWIESILRYGIELYGFASETVLNKLQKVQNKIIKILFKDSKTVKKTDELYLELKILKIKQLRDFVVILNSFFDNKFKSVMESKSLYLRRSSYKYTVPFAKNDYGKKNRAYIVPKLFNGLPDCILNITKLNELKNKLRVYCLNI
jgi:hypothetical protein